MQTPDPWPKRTHTCGELRPAHAEQRVALNGWVHRRRDQGGLIFIDLRDRYGITQIVVSRETSVTSHDLASGVRSEFCLALCGTVQQRPKGTANPELPTGEIEITADEIVVLSTAKPLPFEITGNADVDESLRLRYRYLDLRRSRIRDLTTLRFKITQTMRQSLWERDFLELETPTLVKSTPEGARDFLVPSRHYPGNFYALPQSPQQMKQLLVLGGVDRYFQMARCYRDEDLRANRVAEHTQLDIEMAFVDRDDVLSLIEDLYISLIAKLSAKRIKQIPFPRLTYAETIDRFGTDSPDLRFEIELVDVSDYVRESGFRVFDDALTAGGKVKAIVAPGCAEYSRAQVYSLQDVVVEAGGKGLVTIALNTNGSVRSPLTKSLGEDETIRIAHSAGAEQSDLVCMVAGMSETVATALAALRLHLGDQLDLSDPNELALAWVVDYPLFERDGDSGGLTFSHNPFCSPADDSFELLYTDPARATSKQYDLVCNGAEIGGGSIRAHRPADLHRIYEVMGYTQKEIQDQVGHMLEAFEYGVPPHGGIAMGVDRLAMILGDTPNLRDVIVFPKSQSGLDLMLGAPSPVDDAQLADLNLRLVAAADETPARTR